MVAKAKKLSPRKRAQVDRFFKDLDKEERLIKRAKEKGDLLACDVFHTTIDGKRRTVKINHFEKLVKKNQAMLKRAHRKAIRKGEIRPMNYKLVRTVPYVYANKQVGIMEKSRGIGTLTMNAALEDMERKEPMHNNFKNIQDAKALARRNPQITAKKIDAMKKELKKDLYKISKQGTLFRYDLFGSNNIRILGVDKRTGALEIELLDQVSFGSADKVRKILKTRKRKRRKNRPIYIKKPKISDR